MGNVTIYHNPRCSKSRETLELLKANSIEPEIRLYLEDPPSADELKSVLAMLKISPRELVRTSEEEYQNQGLADPNLDDDSLVNAMVNTPRLIQRPIVISDGRAAIGRPPEQVLEIL